MNAVHILRFMRRTVLVGSPPPAAMLLLFYLIRRGQLLAVGGERDEACGQVDQAADLQVGVGATGGRRAERVPCAHQVAVAPLDAAADNVEKRVPNALLYWSDAEQTAEKEALLQIYQRKR